MKLLLTILGITFSEVYLFLIIGAAADVTTIRSDHQPTDITVGPKTTANPNITTTTTTPTPPTNGTTTTTTPTPPPTNGTTTTTTPTPPPTNGTTTTTTPTPPPTNGTTTTTTTPTTPTTNGTTTTSTTPIPPTTTVKPTAAPTPKPEPDRKFDGPSFIGGMILTLGLMAIGFVSWKFYKARTERNYQTL